MKNKRFVKWVALALAFTQVLLPLGTAWAADPVSDGAVTVEVTAFKLSTKEGAPIKDFSIPIPRDAEFELSFKFSVAEDAEVAGQYFTIPLPVNLTSIADFSSSAQELYVGSEIIGTISITAGGQPTITFADNLTLDEIEGTFGLTGKFMPDEIDDSNTVTFTLDALGIFTFDFEDDDTPDPPDPASASIEKDGSYDPTTNTITWTIDVDPGDLETGESINLVVKDELGPNQTFDSASRDYTTEGDLDDLYVFALNGVTGPVSFTIITTPIDAAFGEEGTSKTLINDVDLYVEGQTEPVDDDRGNVSVPTDWIKKAGVATETGENAPYITWTITLDNNHRGIPAGATVTDTIPYTVGDDVYLEFDPTSVTLNGTTLASSAFSYDDTTGTFRYTFTDGTSASTAPQVITFKTDVTDAYRTQQDVRSFTNTAELIIDSNSYKGSASEGVDNGGVGVDTSLLAKNGAGYDPATQLITWKLKVNSNGKVITNAKLVDTIGTNQAFYAAFAVTRTDGSSTVALTEVTDPAAILAAEQYRLGSDGKLTILLGDLGTDDKPTITFKTKVTNPAHYASNNTDGTNYSNSAVLTGSGIKDSSSTGNQKVTSEVLAKTGTGYDYNTRELSWKVTLNQNKMEMPNAVLTDRIPAGQEYVADSMLIQIGAADPVAAGTELGVSTDNRTLTVTLGAISDVVIITFKTHITDESVFLTNNTDVTFRNDASLSSGITGAPVVTVYAVQTVTNNPVQKKVLPEGGKNYDPAKGYIAWEAFINSNQVNLVSAELSDRLQDGLELDPESIKLYKWNQAADGEMSVDPDEVPASAYSFTYDYDTRLFTVYLPDGAQGYRLEFKTDVNKWGNYTNTMTFSGSFGSHGSGATGSVSVDFDIDYSITGRNGKITVTKKNSTNQEIILGETEFQLLDYLGNVVATKTTENGVVVFDKLKLRVYSIKETKAPLGYVLDDEPYAVDLSKNSPNYSSGQADVVIENDPLTAAITAYKVDKWGNPRTGGSFGIYVKNDDGSYTLVKTVAAISGGVIKFEGLEAGEYQIREITPPAGYKRTSETLDVTLALDEQENKLEDVDLGKEKALVNEQLPDNDPYDYGSLRLQKLDGNSKPLAGAQFGIYSSYGSLLQTAVSDQNGAVVFTNIAYGNYIVKEIAAPAGYTLSQISLSVAVNATSGNQANAYTFVNQKGTLPKTGSFWDSTVLLTLGALLVLAGVFFLVRPALKKKKSGK